MNNVILVGRLTQNPEIEYIGQRAKSKFTIAISRNYTNKEGVRDVDFIPVEIWGRQAEILCKYVFKGMRIGIEGQIRVEKYKTKDGVSKTYTNVVASNFKFLDNKKTNPTQEYFVSNDIFEKENFKEESIEEIFPF
ncbi:single-stranded DNA-binding protein [Romboutsia sp. 1001713B170131_170501_G6]|uniref:single-stranded DNA-binding protein n=1 Tax=Romboutsia sp. 1001713B170131_170501_G6 TaxID=2787108 RepID=UPI0018AA254F|nr:single-stranded DNA-binding protein [Romboutsia sp. 1001713B170131_170501_G6]